MIPRGLARRQVFHAIFKSHRRDRRTGNLAHWRDVGPPKENRHANLVLASGNHHRRNVVDDVGADAVLAAAGNVKAQFRIGVMYVEGRGVPVDYSEAVGWLLQAADQGNTDARDLVAAKMIPWDVAEAQDLAHKWKARTGL